MVLVPPTFDDIRLLDRAKKLLEPVGFGRVSITTADKHDQRIAFTSQMAHVISNAYIKSPTAREHDGFSAGSYKDPDPGGLAQPLHVGRALSGEQKRTSSSSWTPSLPA